MTLIKLKIIDLEVLLKFLIAHIFQTILWIWFIFGMMVDIGTKFYSAIPTTVLMALRSRSQT